MSPLSLRRYRAERLLRQQFETLRGRVLSVVRRRLRAGGVSVDEADLDACYAQAWQGLFMVTLEGQEISNPAGWLVTVTFRRAIEEHRAHRRHGWLWPEGRGGAPLAAAGEAAAAHERDFAAELDDRARLRQLFEALRGRLSPREREAAVLCYLQGLPRAQAASRMGVSEARMRKLMDGRGAGRPGVAGEVGRFLETIRTGGWCEEQASLMRGLAYGLLDPEGERYRLALLHGRACPACRAYVVSLRGLAAALPPPLIGPSLGAAMLALAEGAPRAGAGPAAASANSATAGAGSGAAGGSWALTGPLGAKVAGGLLALGLGAGYVVIEAGPGRAGARPALHASPPPLDLRLSGGEFAPGSRLPFAAPGARSVAIGSGHATTPVTSSGPSVAGREFGPERRAALGGARSGRAGSERVSSARAASSGSPVTPSEREFGPG